jgi:predicted Ser/Thr protein kinase
MASSSILDSLADAVEAVREDFQQEKRVLSFDAYLELFATNPTRYSRPAPEYLRDAFDHFGTTRLSEPWGEVQRYRLFDLGWLPSEEARRESLIGQEGVQAEIYRTLCNFAREGRANRLALLHGPNGSAKTTVARCIMLALEHYSQLDEGALYRFQWVFPTRNVARGAIGFGGKTEQRGTGGSYAHLHEDEIEARIVDEVRDHPLLLIPERERRQLLGAMHERLGITHPPNRWLWHGTLSHKNRAVFDALLASNDGDLHEVLRHVQVERYFISRRYRIGAVTLGPELSIDARERQVTMDRSLSALPSSLQAVSLYETQGELVEASGGVLEFSDLLKRPPEAFKYLQVTVETGEFALPSQNVATNCVMLASANEAELGVFRQRPEFESFRGRIELVRAGYLLSWKQEQQIYDAQIVPQVRGHVAPHATRMAAMFAVLTRLRAPDAEHYPRPVRSVIRSLAAAEKLELYASLEVPTRLDAEKARGLRSVVETMFREFDSHASYEGDMGASPREMRSVLLDAAQNDQYYGLSPFAVLDELDRLCAREGEYSWQVEEPKEGGYHDHAEFRTILKDRLFTIIEDEFRVASQLVDEQSYGELFGRYIHHVSAWVKSEKVKNPMTGDYDDPDEHLMTEVEALLRLPDERDALRHSFMSRIAAWAIEHPGEVMDNRVVFEADIRRLRDAVFADRREALARLCADIVTLEREGGANLDDRRRGEAEKTLARLCTHFGYERGSALDAASRLVKERLGELLA